MNIKCFFTTEFISLYELLMSRGFECNLMLYTYLTMIHLQKFATVSCALCCSIQVDKKKKESALRCSYYNRANSFPHLSFLSFLFQFFYFIFWLVCLKNEKGSWKIHTEQKKNLITLMMNQMEINSQSTLFFLLLF